MYRLICQKPAHFLSAQMFIVLGMYNFDTCLTTVAKKQLHDYFFVSSRFAIL